MGMDYEQLLIFNELSEIIRWQNQSLERMKTFREKYPYLIPPNVARMVEENLKENVQILYRELNHLHKPKEQKQRYVCRECHGVFFVRLPAGLCDECRAKLAAPSRPRYGRVAPPTRTEETEAQAQAETEENQAPAAEEEFGGCVAPTDDLAPKEDD